ncbi:hypothetical protein HY357_02885 [Candidatus Roizmanbacteria bacterium]|nr:hypothetical protein [Candidatus Roizmanbacteria bacterium]
MEKSEQVKRELLNSLKAITEILQSCQAKYRILGSVNAVAYTKRVFRRIEDIDVVLDLKDKECVFNGLKNRGFQVIKKKLGIFYWYESEKKDHLKITFFLIGEFTKDHFLYKYGLFRLFIQSDYIKPVQYNLNGIEFTGVPIASVVDGIRQTSFNPKRTIDRDILAKEMELFNKKMKNKLYIRLGGIKLPLFYRFFSYLCNVYGGISEDKNKYKLF